jgi:hypothetical protein
MLDVWYLISAICAALPRRAASKSRRRAYCPDEALVPPARPMNRSRFIRTALLVVAAAIIGACASLDRIERNAIFKPTRDVTETPASHGAAYEELWIAVGTERVNAWWLRGPASDSPALLYLHGNAENLGPNAPRIARFRDMGFSVLAIDYRGYGKSDGGLPSEASVYADAQAAWDLLRTLAPERKRFIYGHSLGGAVAIELARRNSDASGLVVESTFTSIKDAAADTPWHWLASDWLLAQRFSSIEKIGTLKLPILIIHGMADPLIPYRMSEALYAAANEPKRLLLVPGADHRDVPAVGGERYRAAWRELAELGGARLVAIQARAE